MVEVAWKRMVLINVVVFLDTLATIVKFKSTNVSLSLVSMVDVVLMKSTVSDVCVKLDLLVLIVKKMSMIVQVILV